MAAANPAVLSAAGRLRAAQMHGFPDDVVARRRQEVVLARAQHLLRSSGVLPLEEGLIAELVAAARGAH
ncbi:hypothetical protein C8E05_6306 [Rhodococcus wratislaviensis]|uniref:Uncharacterized protein n=1 Tax=Rhodococcus wratislaviensis TaxID=44752 RepID=A0AB38FFJ5_RHOWR|nr:hypothetical protein C8E05_6306 [Rhodococcus wratislaviensis]SPZ40395.1 Uncharacterised protein [Rhodococcus wratislaviensis]